MDRSNQTKQEKNRQQSHMPKDSFLFEKIIPWLLVFMTVVTVGLIIFAAGVIFGFVQF